MAISQGRRRVFSWDNFFSGATSVQTMPFTECETPHSVSCAEALTFGLDTGAPSRAPNSGHSPVESSNEPKGSDRATRQGGKGPEPCHAARSVRSRSAPGRRSCQRSPGRRRNASAAGEPAENGFAGSRECARMQRVRGSLEWRASRSFVDEAVRVGWGAEGWEVVELPGCFRG